MTPRLRMIAGPNGSGKSTIRGEILEGLIGHFVNADEIAEALWSSAGLNLANFKISKSSDDVRSFALGSPLFVRTGIEDVKQFSVEGDVLRCGTIKSNAYVATLVADFIRRSLIEQHISFTFETVMSSPDKIETLALAKSRGYRTYLYYLGTEDVEINISRVENRVAEGGHSVPEIKIRERYTRSLDLLLEAIRKTDRAYIFDTSGNRLIWVAEITNGTDMEFKSDMIPAWFKKAVLDKIPSP